MHTDTLPMECSALQSANINDKPHIQSSKQHIRPIQSTDIQHCKNMSMIWNPPPRIKWNTSNERKNLCGTLNLIIKTWLPEVQWHHSIQQLQVRYDTPVYTSPMTTVKVLPLLLKIGKLQQYAICSLDIGTKWTVWEWLVMLWLLCRPQVLIMI